MLVAALVAAIAVGTRISAANKVPMTIAALRELIPRLRISLA
jgi:hypothetical protein